MLFRRSSAKLRGCKILLLRPREFPPTYFARFDAFFLSILIPLSPLSFCDFLNPCWGRKPFDPKRYLCGVLDPLPSSPIVCRLRREVARRIDLLAAAAGTGVVTVIVTADAVSKERERKPAERGLSDIRGARAFPRFGHVGMMASGGDSCGHKIEENALPNCRKSRDTCEDSATRKEGRLGRRHSSFVDILAGSSARRLSTTRLGAVACSVPGRTTRSPWVADEEPGPGLPHHKLGSKKIYSGSGSSGSNSNSGSDSSGSSGSDPSRDDLSRYGNGKVPSFRNERAAMTTTKMRNASREATQYNLDQVRESGRKGVGCSNDSSRWTKGGPRAGEVRFSLENEEEITKEGEGRPIPSSLTAKGSGGEGFQAVQKHAGRGGCISNSARVIDKAQTEIVEPNGLWTCIACRQTNDEMDGAEGCASCGRRRQRRRQTRPHENDGTQLAMVPSCNVGTGARSMQAPLGGPEERDEETMGSFRNSIEPPSDVGANSPELGSKTRSDRLEQRMARSDRRGPYDMSSFAKMRQATQPVVKARLGLTREIQSLLSAIRR